jgi:SAM-dependent methyltransferase
MLLRRLIPLWAYPILAPAIRWRRARAIARMKADDAVYLREHPEVRAPGPELRFGVGAPISIAEFLESGRTMAADLEAALASAGGSVGDVGRALDFGCGCGRLLIEARLRWPRIRWTGCDVDRPAVDWCANHLPEVRTFVNEPGPPLALPDAELDLVWCGSVFTHLDEARQDAWLDELRRVLRPGGWLLASVLGPTRWADLPPATVRTIREKGFLFARTEPTGWIRPEWYQTAWHTEDYVRRHWSRGFEVCRYLPQGLHANQDLAVLRRTK